jgi:hypothetical protein
VGLLMEDFKLAMLLVVDCREVGVLGGTVVQGGGRDVRDEEVSDV